MKRAAFAIAITVGTLGEARADEPRTTCDAAFELQLRPSEAHLLDARESLRTCALPVCRAWMIDDCAKRLVELEQRIPSIVFSADNGRGSPLYDIRVREGVRELVPRIDGRAVEMDPGPHTLVAERGDQRVTLTVVAIEGRRAQQVVFSFLSPEETAPAAAPRSPRYVPAHAWGRPVAVGLAAGAVVASGLGIGFGISALDKKSNAGCNDADVCQGSPRGALGAAHASTASFIVAGGLAAGSAITFLAFGRTTVQAALGGARIGATW